MDNELEKQESPAKSPRRRGRTTSRQTEVSQTEPEVTEVLQADIEVPVAEPTPEPAPEPEPEPAPVPEPEPEPAPAPAPTRVRKSKTILPSIPTGVSNRGMRNRI